MCGIYAILTKQDKLDPRDLSAFWDMAILTQLRGTDSSGIFAVSPRKSPHIVKCVGPSFNLFAERNFNSWYEFAKEKAVAIVGHGRSATQGNIIKKNAHPFQTEHITLVHNGTISFGLDNKEGEVDSAALCAAIASEGLEKTLNKIHGSYALVIHDAKENSIKIVRNTSRPLAYLETNSAIYILSENSALEYLAARTMHITGQVHSFEPMRLYTFNLETKQCISQKLEYQPLFEPKKLIPISPQKTEPVQDNKSIYSAGDSITFTLKKKRKVVNSNETIYVGEDKDGNTVYFKTTTPHENFIGKTGTGTCVYAVYANSVEKWVYQVKTRSIVWQDEVPFVTTFDGEVIEKSVWRDLCNTQTCHFCLEKVDEQDHEETIVINRGSGNMNLMCKKCINLWTNNVPSDSVLHKMMLS